MHITSTRFIFGAAEPGRYPEPVLPEIAFAGRSNVGKSSLLNCLVGRHALARVSKTPGRTQQINFFVLNERVVFVDLPGYGFAHVPLAVKARWKQLVEEYLHARPVLRGIVQLVDARRGVDEQDQALLEFLAAAGIPVVLVATKIDKLNRSERARQLKALAVRPLPGVCAICVVASTTGEGMRELWREIDALLR